MSDGSLVQAIDWVDAMKSRGWRLSGGVVQLPADLPTFNTTSPRAFTQLLEFESKLAQPVELELQLQSQPVPTPDGFPDGASSVSPCAGAYQFGTPWNLSAPNIGIVIAKYETGSGADARTFYSDVRPGRFALGVQQRVRMSVARWLVAGVAGSFINIQGSIAPARGTDADPPTYTCGIDLPLGDDLYVMAPPGAMYWTFDCVANAGFSAQVIAQIPGQAQFYRDTNPAAAILYPPAPAWPLGAGDALIHFINAGVDCRLFATFWVR